MTFILLFAVATWAGAQNALAGGGSFLTLPTLMFTGMDALAANITSCAALFPAQVATGWTGRKLARGANGLSLRTLFVISIVGGAVGAAVLLGTPRGLFARLVPWLVLFATVVFAWGSFFRKPVETHSHLGRAARGPRAISDFGLRRLFRRRHRLPHGRRADHGRTGRARRQRHQKRSGRRHERLRRRDLPVLAGSALAAGAGDERGRDDRRRSPAPA